MGDPALVARWRGLWLHRDTANTEHRKQHFHSYLVLKSELRHVRFEERQNKNNVEQGTFSLEHGTYNEFSWLKKEFMSISFVAQYCETTSIYAFS